MQFHLQITLPAAIQINLLKHQAINCQRPTASYLDMHIYAPNLRRASKDTQLERRLRTEQSRAAQSSAAPVAWSNKSQCVTRTLRVRVTFDFCRFVFRVRWPFRAFYEIFLFALAMHAHLCPDTCLCDRHSRTEIETQASCNVFVKQAKGAQPRLAESQRDAFFFSIMKCVKSVFNSIIFTNG